MIWDQPRDLSVDGHRVVVGAPVAALDLFDFTVRGVWYVVSCPGWEPSPPPVPVSHTRCLV